MIQAVSGVMMRSECEVMLPGGICGKPAVDRIPDGLDGWFNLCAQHWDEMHADPDEDDYEDDDEDDDEDDEDHDED